MGGRGGPCQTGAVQTGAIGARAVWAERAAAAEAAVTSRFVRRLAGVVPGTRLGRIRWPRPVPIRPWPWHYWWQAHLLDCLVDAQMRLPTTERAGVIAAVVRTVRARNLGSWTNRYYDDVAWFGLAVQRAGTLARRSARPALGAVTAHLRGGWTPDGGGGIWWRVGDDVKNAPANGPAAILLARSGYTELAASITDWMAETLVDPATGLVRDGVRIGSDGRVRAVDPTPYTYCQGVHLGACVALHRTDGDPRWAERSDALLEAVGARIAGPDGVVPGYDDGGDGGLFNGILARYLVDAAIRLPALAPAATRIVLASAEAAWAGRVELPGGPVFAPDWRRPARVPMTGAPETDLSVQLSAWMLLEAAAAVERAT
jgi:predicted alpha-1,6-mannanase (GH76 family)